MPALVRLESELRGLARELIREGRLPDRAPARVWGGAGSERPCAVCGDVIPASDMEYETDALLGNRLQTLHFHFICHAAWQLECVRVDYASQVHDTTGLPMVHRAVCRFRSRRAPTGARSGSDGESHSLAPELRCLKPTHGEPRNAEARRHQTTRVCSFRALPDRLAHQTQEVIAEMTTRHRAERGCVPIAEAGRHFR